MRMLKVGNRYVPADNVACVEIVERDRLGVYGHTVQRVVRVWLRHPLMVPKEPARWYLEASGDEAEAIREAAAAMVPPVGHSVTVRECVPLELSAIDAGD